MGVKKPQRKSALGHVVTQPAVKPRVAVPCGFCVFDCDQMSTEAWVVLPTTDPSDSFFQHSLPSFFPSCLEPAPLHYPVSSRLAALVLPKSSSPALQAHLEEIMSVNGGGGFTSHWHNGTNGINSHMGLKTDISEEEYKNYEHGVQVIDENKELTYVQFLPLVTAPPFPGGNSPTVTRQSSAESLS